MGFEGFSLRFKGVGLGLENLGLGDYLFLADSPSSLGHSDNQ